jgi:hypothetical protein
MAASLFAVIDWDNMTYNELVTACKLLMSATQERVTIGQMPLNQKLGSNLDVFDWGNNTPAYKLSDGDPLILPNSTIESMLNTIAANYVDIAKTEDFIGDSVSFIGGMVKRLNASADDPSYPNRLLELAGYTSYPDFSDTVTTHEVKKWYDILGIAKYVGRTKNISTTTNTYTRVRVDGEMDKTNSGATNYLNWSEAYGTSPASGRTTTSTEWSNFDTAHADLFGEGDEEFWFEEGEGVGQDFRRVYTYRAEYDSTGYNCWARGLKYSMVLDYSLLHTNAGGSGLPISYKAYSLLDFTIDGTDTTNGFTAPTFNKTEDVIYEATLTTSTASAVVTVTETPEINEAGIPSTAPTPASTTTSRAFVEQYMNNFLIEDWDGDGGFEYYTPP